MHIFFCVCKYYCKFCSVVQIYQLLSFSCCIISFTQWSCTLAICWLVGVINLKEQCLESTTCLVGVSLQIDLKAGIRTVIFSHMDVCKNKITYNLSDKTRTAIYSQWGSEFFDTAHLETRCSCAVTWLSTVNKINFIYKCIISVKCISKYLCKMYSYYSKHIL